MRTRETLIWTVDPAGPDPALVASAAEVIRSGGLVAFPTETVYGLGANALDGDAVRRIFEAKGRPATNPVIVHVASPAEAAPLVTAWPEEAERLAATFWPGPLTLVLQRSRLVPDVVTGGGPTIAIRCPAHSIARALIAAAGVPIAAPSANRSSELSPTLAKHVQKSLDGRIDVILDGGPTIAGLESTVIDLSGPVPRVLRPGPIPASQLRQVLGEVEIAESKADVGGPALPSPGMLARHYAPRTPLECHGSRSDLEVRRAELTKQGRKVGVLQLEADPAVAAEHLYRRLHEMDEAGLDVILVELPPAEDKWLALRDRLLRAAAAE